MGAARQGRLSRAQRFGVGKRQSVSSGGTEAECEFTYQHNNARTYIQQTNNLMGMLHVCQPVQEVCVDVLGYRDLPVAQRLQQAGLAAA